MTLSTMLCIEGPFFLRRWKESVVSMPAFQLATFNPLPPVALPSGCAVAPPGVDALAAAPLIGVRERERSIAT